MGCAYFVFKIMNNPFVENASACFLDIEVELNCWKCI